ncbi:MAG: inositol monophosphatase family protein, partial [Flavobacteriales bacterium]
FNQFFTIFINFFMQKELKKMNYEKICAQVAELSKDVGHFIKNSKEDADVGLNFKSSNDLVTKIDIEAENRFVNGLKKILPEAGFITEEISEHKQSNEFNWIVDPLDGTTNFVHGIPMYCTSVALMYKNEVKVGVIHEINQEETFKAGENAPAELNDKEINCSHNDIFQNALLVTGFPYSPPDNYDRYIGLFKHMQLTSRGVRRLGSAAMDLAYVACGRFDVFWEYGLNPWDVAAGSLIVERAGGIVTDFYDKRDFVFGRSIIASAEHVREEFMGEFRKFY